MIRRICNLSPTAAVMLLGAWLCTACLGGKVYDEYQELPLAGWEKVDRVSFNIPSMTTTGIYDVEMGLRTTGDYPFMNLSLIVEPQVIRSNGNQTMLSPVVMRCKLVDIHGHTHGQGINYYQHDFHVTTLQLHTGDSLILTIHHDMKREVLPGLSDMGIRLTRRQ